MEVYDAAIIGGGVIGCAILHELTNQGYKCILLEKNPDLASEASGGNSGIAHTGFDAKPGSLEHTCLRRSQDLMGDVWTKYSLPYKLVGAVMVAWDQQQMKQLSTIAQNALNAGVTDARILDKEEILQMEPHLNPTLLGGLIIPGEALVDSWLAPLVMAHAAVRNGATMLLNSEVTAGKRTRAGYWQLHTAQRSINAKVVINAAGLYGDKVEEISHNSTFRIKPRKGQYIVYNKEAGKLLNHIILPVPTERTKGIIIFPSVYGNLVVGPDAEDVSERNHPHVSPGITKQLIEHAQRILPAIADHKVEFTYAGLRPATETADYHIISHPDRNWVTVGGIRSTGVSACLGIAQYVHDQLKTQLRLMPGGERPSVGNIPSYKATIKPRIVIDGTEYNIKHPLSKAGLLCAVKSKL